MPEEKNCLIVGSHEVFPEIVKMHEFLSKKEGNSIRYFYQNYDNDETGSIEFSEMDGIIVIMDPSGKLTKENEILIQNAKKSGKCIKVYDFRTASLIAGGYLNYK